MEMPKGLLAVTELLGRRERDAPEGLMSRYGWGEGARSSGYPRCGAGETLRLMESYSWRLVGRAYFISCLLMGLPGAGDLERGGRSCGCRPGAGDLDRGGKSCE